MSITSSVKQESCHLEPGNAQERLNNCNEHLVELELELTDLTFELDSCADSYNCLVAPKYAQLDSTLATVAEMIATLNSASPQAEERAHKLRAQSWQTTEELEKLGQTVPFTSSPYSSILREMFKRVVRVNHPAFTSNEQQRMKQAEILTQARRALVAGDEITLGKLLESGQDNLGSTGADTVLLTEELIKQVDKEISAIEARIAALKNTDRYELWLKTKEALNGGVNLLEQIAETIDKQLGYISKHLETLLEAMESHE